MTVCIGMPLNKQHAFILADSCGLVDGEYVRDVRRDKITRTYAANSVPVIFGCSGHNRWSQLVKYKLNITHIEFIPKQPDYNHFVIVHELVTALHALATETGAIPPQPDKAAGIWGNAMLVAIGPAVWEITEAFDVLPLRHGFCVIGNGLYATSGALRALLSNTPNASPVLTARAAADIGAEFFIGIKPPYYMYTTDPDDQTCHEL